MQHRKAMRSESKLCANLISSFQQSSRLNPLLSLYQPATNRLARVLTSNALFSRSLSFSQLSLTHIFLSSANLAVSSFDSSPYLTFFPYVGGRLLSSSRSLSRSSFYRPTCVSISSGTRWGITSAYFEWTRMILSAVSGMPLGLVAWWQKVLRR